MNLAEMAAMKLRIARLAEVKHFIYMDDLEGGVEDTHHPSCGRGAHPPKTAIRKLNYVHLGGD